MGSYNWEQPHRGNLKDCTFNYKKKYFLSKRRPTSVDQNTKAVFQIKLWTTTPAWLLATASMLTSQTILNNRERWLFKKVLFSLYALLLSFFKFRIAQLDQSIGCRPCQASSSAFWICRKEKRRTRIFEAALQELQRKLYQEYAVWPWKKQLKLAFLFTKTTINTCV